MSPIAKNFLVKIAFHRYKSKVLIKIGILIWAFFDVVVEDQYDHDHISMRFLYTRFIATKMIILYFPPINFKI